MEKLRGFTLVELMIVLVIAAILGAMAMPSMRDFVRDNRLATETNTMITALALARSEATKRRRRVAVCSSTNPAATTPACNGSAGNWDGGWLVFEDSNANSSYSSANDVLLRRQAGPGGEVTVRSNNAASTLILYQPNGTLLGGTSPAFSICDSRGAGDGRKITVTAVGRSSLERGGISSCTSP